MACSPLPVSSSVIVPDESRLSALARLLAEIAEPISGEVPSFAATDLPSELVTALATWARRERYEA